MKRQWLIIVAALAMAVPALGQQIVDVHQSGDKIVVEYDLSHPAEFVRLYVSTDGGDTYRGPLKQVEGDIKDVPSGYNRSITWDVLKEFKTFESDNVRFKLSIKLKEKWTKATFVTANAAYSFAPQASFGFSAGQVKHFGWFVSVMTNGSLSGFSYDADCDGDGYTAEGYLPTYTGDKSKTRLSVTGGGVMRLTGPLSVRVGVGYGNRTLRWKTSDGSWNRVKEFSSAGIDLSAGLQLNIGGFAASLEAVTTQFQTVEGRIGLGITF